MTQEIVQKRVVDTKPVIQVYTRGTVHFNKAAHHIMRGWTGVLVTFDRETRLMRLVRDVSLPAEKLDHARKITKSGSTICITSKALLTDFGVTEQHNVRCNDHGLDFIEFGPLEVGGKDVV